MLGQYVQERRSAEGMMGTVSTGEEVGGYGGGRMGRDFLWCLWGNQEVE